MKQLLVVASMLYFDLSATDMPRPPSRTTMRTIFRVELIEKMTRQLSLPRCLALKWAVGVVCT